MRVGGPAPTTTPPALASASATAVVAGGASCRCELVRCRCCLLCALALQLVGQLQRPTGLPVLSSGANGDQVVWRGVAIEDLLQAEGVVLSRKLHVGVGRGLNGGIVGVNLKRCVAADAELLALESERVNSNAGRWLDAWRAMVAGPARWHVCVVAL